MAEFVPIMAAATAAASQSFYRVKFRRDEFLRIVDAMQPKIIYRVRNVHFLSIGGLAVYTRECVDSDFSQKIMEGIEFSNEPWQKT